MDEPPLEFERSIGRVVNSCDNTYLFVCSQHVSVSIPRGPQGRQGHPGKTSVL